MNVGYSTSAVRPDDGDGNKKVHLSLSRNKHTIVI